MIEIHLLEQLAAFEEYKTLSKAAEKLLVSQPALSRSMHKLEDRMGVPLFDRQKNKISLNKNGELVAEYAKQILNKEKEMLERVRSLEYSNHTITYGSVAPGPNIYYPSILSGLYPDMEVTSELKNEEILLTGLENGTYQFIFLNHKINDKELFCTKAASEHLYLTVLPGHPASSLDKISFKDMDGESFLMYAHVGFWDNIVRKNMPSSRFLLQNEYNDFGEIVNSTSLPCFGSNLAKSSDTTNMAKRVYIPFSDKEASTTYYFVCKQFARKKYQEFIRNLVNPA